MNRKRASTVQAQPEQCGKIISSTERNRRLRQRQKAGIEISSLPIQLFGYELNEMVERGLLTKETRLDRIAVAEAVEAIIKRWSVRR